MWYYTGVSRREKLVQELLGFPPTLRFSSVKLIIESHGYAHHQPSGGSHHIFRKPGHDLISIPVHGNRVKRVYLKDVAKKLGFVEDDDDE
jgi:predicted RNA binding protein YcfA (HicA-like mRNA interferase family)